MLIKPPTCHGCPLFNQSTGFMLPELGGEDRYKVTLLGEALGEKEAELGGPFKGPAGYKLTQLIGWAGLERGKFDIINSAWCRPPDNWLEGAPYEKGAVTHCKREHWARYLDRSDVLVPLGNVALNAVMGRKGILSARGYVYPAGSEVSGWNGHILPTVHPSFIQRGNAKYSAAFIHDIQRAVEIARDGLAFQDVDYTIDPTPSVAMDWAKHYLAVFDSDPSTSLAYDIETPHKGDDESELEDFDGDDESFYIWRIGFSYKPYHALSIPWTPEYISAIRSLLGSSGSKVVWNAGFDNPRIRHNGVEINGPIHDGMVAWHILHSDLPKGLGFVATFTCPNQPAWKHLSKQSPGYYNATDADVELRSMLVIKEELKKSGLWTVYQRDVLDLDPILLHMTAKGMPLDAEVREDRAIKLSNKLIETYKQMEEVVPLSARTLEKPYVKTPDDTTGCVEVTVVANVKRCSRCGEEKPTKPHFRTLKRPTEKRPQNPCSGAEVVEGPEEVRRWARLRPFKPSIHQLTKYQEALGRLVPTVYDKKTKTRKASMGEKQLKKLTKLFPDDILYPTILKYRELDKVAGTYIGRPA